MNLKRNVQRESTIDEYVFCVIAVMFCFCHGSFSFLICNFVVFSRYRFIHCALDSIKTNHMRKHRQVHVHTYSSILSLVPISTITNIERLLATTTINSIDETGKMCIFTMPCHGNGNNSRLNGLYQTLKYNGTKEFDQISP